MQILVRNVILHLVSISHGAVSAPKMMDVFFGNPSVLIETNCKILCECLFKQYNFPMVQSECVAYLSSHFVSKPHGEGLWSGDIRLASLESKRPNPGNPRNHVGGATLVQK